MLYEISFPDGSKVEYIDLVSVRWSELGTLISKHKKPFKTTPIEGGQRTKYCFSTSEGEWIGMYFTPHYANNTSIPVFCVIKGISSNQVRLEKALQLFQSTFGNLPEDLDPSYVV